MRTGRDAALRVSTFAAVCGALLVLSGCSSTASTITPTTSPPTSSPSQTPSATPSTPSASVTSPAATVALKPAPAGYTYVAVPAEFSTLTETMMKTGMIVASDAHAVNDSSGNLVAIIFGFKYNAALAAQLDQTAIDKVLDGSAAGAKAFLSGSLTSYSAVFSGTHVRIIAGKDMALGVAYEKGGTLIEIFGPDKTTLLKFMRAYYA